MSRRKLVNRSLHGAALAYIACLVLPVSVSGKTSTPQTAQTEKADQVPVELYQAPRPKNIDAPECAGGHLDSTACKTLESGIEGWVELGFMVDPSGKPFEVTVIRSTGVKEFEDLAVQAMEHSTFVPGSLDGKPIESDSEMKYVFRNGETSASSLFVRAYKELQQAVSAGDQAAADEAMKKLHPTNFYEDAYFGLATYFYASRWGDESQQLSGLRRAIAYENSPTYLPKPLFESVLLGSMKLEINLHQYAEALTTAKTLQKNALDTKTAAVVASLVEQVQQLRLDGQAYEVAGSMPDGRWYLHLFKSHFQAEITQGSIAEVKLRCEKRYVSFVFDPKLQYTVSSKDGPCSIELDGAPGTTFKLVQF